MKPLPEWQGRHTTEAVSNNTNTFHVLDTQSGLYVTTKQAFRELILPLRITRIYKNPLVASQHTLGGQDYQKQYC